MTLQVIPTFLEALREIGRAQKALLRALLIPALMLASASVLEAQHGDSFLVRSLVALFNTVVGAMFAISCHRIVLLGEEALSNPYGVYLSAREVRFIGWSILVGLICLGVFICTFIAALLVAGLALVAGEEVGLTALFVLIWPGVLITVYLGSRFSILLPAAAVDRRPTLRGAWAQTRGQGWRILLLLLLGSSPGLLPAGVLVLVGPPRGGIWVPFSLYLLASLLGAVVVVTLSVIYRTLARDGGDAVNA